MFQITLHSRPGGTARYWWWTLRSAGNGAVLATSETYTTRRKALEAARKVNSRLGAGEIIER